MLLRALLCLAFFLLNVPAVFAADKSIDLRIKEPSASTAAPRRLALVVGNSAYRFSGALANPASDAELIAKTLKEVGFRLHGGGAQVNLTRAALDQAIESFGDALRPGDVALFYYSGHGLQVNGENYLVPVDADIKKEPEVRVKTVPVNLLFAKLEGVKDAVNIVILDACRNNPFARSFRSSGGGLAAVNAPTGTIVAFSTGPGQVAEDGAGKNSTYTAALAQYVREPGLKVEDVFKKVRTSVSSLTKGNQTPWENTSLTGDFSFISRGDVLSQKNTDLSKLSKERRAELERLQNLEAESKRQQEKEQAEIAKREAEIARMDAEIAATKARVGTASAVSGKDSLDELAKLVKRKEKEQQKLAQLRVEAEEEARERQEKLDRIKEKQEAARNKAIAADLDKYEQIVSSPQGAELKGAAWRALVSRYGEAAQLQEGDLYGFYTALDYQGSDWGAVERKHQKQIAAEAQGKQAREAEAQRLAAAEAERLSKLPGTINVTSSPSGANWYLDNKLIGTTPGQIKAYPGTYEVIVGAKGYQNSKWRVPVVAQKVAQVNAVLEKMPAERSAVAVVEQKPVVQSSGKRGYTDPTTGVEFVFVKGGCFQMGNSGLFADLLGEAAFENEKPIHEACVNDFFLGKTEVTVGQFRKFVDDVGYRTEAEQGDGCFVWNGSTWAADRGKNWRDPGFRQGDSQPVACVSWNDAMAYAAWLAQKSGKGMRLPTEAEWEYAARSGGKHEKFAGGVNVDAVAWYSSNSGSSTQPVGHKQANGLGLFDMSGNVWEWCGDWYGDKYYAQSPRQNPSGPSEGSVRVNRGGSWNIRPDGVRSALRNWGAPDDRNSILGFRLAFPAR